MISQVFGLVGFILLLNEIWDMGGEAGLGIKTGKFMNLRCCRTSRFHIHWHRHGSLNHRKYYFHKGLPDCMAKLKEVTERKTVYE